MNCFRPRGTIPYRPTGVTNANGMPDMKHTHKNYYTYVWLVCLVMILNYINRCDSTAVSGLV